MGEGKEDRGGGMLGSMQFNLFSFASSYHVHVCFF
jgi:hypothetical protein